MLVIKRVSLDFFGKRGDEEKEEEEEKERRRERGAGGGEQSERVGDRLSPCV